MMTEQILRFRTLVALEIQMGYFAGGITKLQICTKTRLRRSGNSFIVRFYDTDIIAIHHDGTYTTAIDPNRRQASINRIKKFVPREFWPTTI